MSAAQRKIQTETFLASRGISPDPALPPLDEAGAVHLRDAAAVARRVMVLAYLNVIAESGDKGSVVRHLKEAGLWPALSATEMVLLKKKVLSQKEKVDISWRMEGIWTMLWALQKLPSLDWPAGQCSIGAMLRCLPGFLCPAPEFYTTARLRPLTELLDAADLYYRLHHAPGGARVSSLEVDPAIVAERHAALRWILSAEENWDQVTDALQH